MMENSDIQFGSIAREMKTVLSRREEDNVESKGNEYSCGSSGGISNHLLRFDSNNMYFILGVALQAPQ